MSKKTNACKVIGYRPSEEQEKIILAKAKKAKLKPSEYSRQMSVNGEVKVSDFSLLHSLKEFAKEFNKECENNPRLNPLRDKFVAMVWDRLENEV